MRTAFINTLIKLAKKDKRIFLLTGDLGFSVLEGFRDEFPDRFINMGVAEANMIGVAAGLALSGKVVFVYSIVPFVTLRCLEQIRNDVCYQKLQVRIIGVGAGLSYGTSGATHYSLEDIAVMRAISNLSVVCPGDPLEAEMALKESLSYAGPLYIRLGKGNDPLVHRKLEGFKIGKAIFLEYGKDIAIISTGNMLPNVKQAASLLKKQGVDARLISMHTVKPIDKKAIINIAKKTKAIFTVEEHNFTGGLGSAVAEVLAEQSAKVYFKRIAVSETLFKAIGSQDYLRSKFGLDANGIFKTILKNMGKIKHG